MRFFLDETRTSPRLPRLSEGFWILTCLLVRRHSQPWLEREVDPALPANPFSSPASTPREGGGGRREVGREESVS